MNLLIIRLGIDLLDPVHTYLTFIFHIVADCHLHRTTFSTHICRSFHYIKNLLRLRFFTIARACSLNKADFLTHVTGRNDKFCRTRLIRLVFCNCHLYILDRISSCTTFSVQVDPTGTFRIENCSIPLQRRSKHHIKSATFFRYGHKSRLI